MLEAILLVGGHGTRLRPLTMTTPKPLLPTAGVPFLAHQLAMARSYGVRHVVFATAYKASMFSSAFGDGSDLGLTLSYVEEASPLGTGGAIRNASSALRGGPGDPVVVLNGDILSGHSLTSQLALHRESSADVTLHLTSVSDPSRFGCVPTDASGKVSAFLEKTPDPVTNRINAGCYVFRRSVIDSIPPGEVVSVERETFPSLISSGAIVMGYADSAYWLDVGTPSAFVRGSCDLVLGELASPVMPPHSGTSLLLDGSSVAPDAVVTGGSVIGRRSKVGPGAVLRGSVLFDDVVIDEGASVIDSVVGQGARIEPGAVLNAAVIGDNAVIGAGNELNAGARVWPGIELPPCAIRFSSDV